jgi:hypothetical protein
MLDMGQLHRETFNQWMKTFSFDPRDDCSFHRSKNKGREEAKRFHCALQDACTYGRAIEATQNDKEGIERISQEKYAEQAEFERLKQLRLEEEMLQLTGLPWCFRTQGERTFYCGRSPSSLAEMMQLQETCGISMIVSGEGLDHIPGALEESDLGFFLLDLNPKIPQTSAGLDYHRKVLRELIRDQEVVYLCAKNVAVLRDIWRVFRNLDCNRSRKQWEKEWSMLRQLQTDGAGVRVNSNEMIRDYCCQYTMCEDWNRSKGKCKGLNSNCHMYYRHHCVQCGKNTHRGKKCPQIEKK